MTATSAPPVDPDVWASHAFERLRIRSAESLRVVAALAAIATAEAADGTGEFGPGLYRLSGRADVTKRTTAANLRRLVALGWLERTVAGGRGGGTRSLYRLTIPAGPGAR